MKIIGGLLIAFGLADVLGSWAGEDLWGDWIGVQLPDLLWRFSGFIELGLGYFLFQMGDGDEGATSAAEPPAE